MRNSSNVNPSELLWIHIIHKSFGIIVRIVCVVYRSSRKHRLVSGFICCGPANYYLQIIENSSLYVIHWIVFCRYTTTSWLFASEPSLKWRLKSAANESGDDWTTP